MAASPPFLNRVIAANRVLLDLDTIDRNRRLSLTDINTLRAAQRMLTELEGMRISDLASDQAKALQDLIDRLQAKLKLFA
jgi:hypothetical protein